MEAELEHHGGGGAGELVRAVWRRKWLPPLCLVLIAGPALIYVWKFQQPEFSAKAKVLLDMKTRPTRVLGAPEMGSTFNLQTELEIMQTQAIMTRAANVLDLAGLDHIWLRRLGFDIGRNSRVMTISSRGPTAEVTRDLANALADGYVEHRRKIRIDETSETLTWLREQQADSKVKLLQAEEAFQKFKKSNGIPSLESKREADVQRYQTLSDSYLQAQKLRIEIETELRSLEKEPDKTPASRPTEAGAKAAAASTKGKEGSAKPTEKTGEQRPSTKEHTEQEPAKAVDESAVAIELAGDMPPMLQQLDTTIRAREVQLKAQSEVLKDRHPTIRQLKRELDLLRTQYQAAKEEMEQRRQALLKQRAQQRVVVLRRRVGALRSEETQAEQALKDWRNQLLMVTDVAVEYRILERETLRVRQSYELITGKITELNLASASSDDTARVLDHAELGEPVDLKNRRTVIMATFGAFALSVMICLLLERLDTSIKTSEDVERYLGLPVVALIPTYPEKDKRREKRLRRERRKRLTVAEEAAG